MNSPVAQDYDDDFRYVDDTWNAEEQDANSAVLSAEQEEEEGDLSDEAAAAKDGSLAAVSTATGTVLKKAQEKESN